MAGIIRTSPTGVHQVAGKLPGTGWTPLAHTPSPFRRVKPVAARPSTGQGEVLDSSYNNQIAGLNQQVSQYSANAGINRSRIAENRILTLDQMNRGQQGDLKNLLSGFAGRGMARSSEYGFEQADTNRDFSRRTADVNRSATQSTADLDRQLADFKSTVGNARATARSDAIARKAARYGSF